MRLVSPARRRSLFLVGALAGAAVLGGGALLCRSQTPESDQTRELAPGLTLRSVVAQTPQGGLRFWLVKASPAFDLGLLIPDPANAQRKRSVRALAAQSGAIVAVNGGFFAYGGAAVGAVKTNGTWQRLPWKSRTALGWNNAQDAQIGPLSGGCQLRIETSDGRVQLAQAALNGFALPGTRQEIADGFAVLTPQFARAYTPRAGEVAVSVPSGRVMSFQATTANSQTPTLPTGTTPDQTTANSRTAPKETTATPQGTTATSQTSAPQGITATSPTAPQGTTATSQNFPTGATPPAQTTTSQRTAPANATANPATSPTAPANVNDVDLQSASFVVIARGEAAKKLDLTKTPRFSFSVQTSPDWNRFANVLGAGPRLVAHGQIKTTEIEEEFRPDVLARGPRTCVGWDGEHNWLLLVADGRSASSVGLTLPETAGLFQRLGAVEAMNLDGGSSTQLVVGGELVNTPSGFDPVNPTRPREVQVINALTLKAHATP